MNDIHDLVKAYFEDLLTDEERVELEQKLAKGDPDIVKAVQELKPFYLKDDSDKNNPDQPIETHSLLHLVRDSDLDSQETDSKKDNNHSNRIGLAEALQEVEKKNIGKQRSFFYFALGIIIIILLMVVLYLQWQNHFLIQKEKRQLSEIEELTKRLTEKNIELRTANFDIDRIRNLVSGDFFLFDKMELKGERGNWIQMWDRGTLRIAVWIDKAQFDNNEIVQLWSRNARTREWLLVGTINEFKKDSLYTEWNTRNLSKSSELEVRLLQKSEDDSINEITLAKKRVKR